MIRHMENENRTYHEAQSQMEYLPNYYRWTYRHIRHAISGRVIELGCGAGIGIRYYEDIAEEIIAVDYNPKLLERVADTYQAEKVKTKVMDLTDDWSHIKGMGADAMILMDVLEHFADDVRFMTNARDCLAKNGKLAVKVPAQAKLYCAIDEASGHYRRYDRADIEGLAAKVGLKLLSLRSINPLGAFAYKRKRKSQSNFSKTFSVPQLKVINALIPPITLLDHVPFFAGQSYVAIMEKI